MTEVKSADPSPDSHRPVFADERGRRARLAVVAGHVVVLVCLLYMTLVLASLVGAPWVPSVGLPTVGPERQDKVATTPVTLPPTAPTQPAPVPPGRAERDAPTTSTSSGATSTAVPGRRVGQPTTTATTAPDASTSSTGSTTSAPGRSGTTPGRDRRGG